MQSHATLYAAAALLLIVPTQSGAQSASPAGQAPEVLRVFRYADDGGEGTLRWAIEKSNSAPGRHRIEIIPTGSAPYVIRPISPLPRINGPVQIEGTAWKVSGEYIVIDGSGYIEDRGPESCPGAVPGQYGTNVRTTTSPGLHLVDTQGIEISGLEIRKFCIGILINRASGNFIHDSRIVANRGGAGVMLTGDDGSGNPTATTTVQNKVLRNEFLDNGDGLELTRGAAFNLVANNVFRSTNANPEPSQGIEVLFGNDNVVVRNRFEGYSDGIQVNSGHRNYIAANTFSNNTFGLSLTGFGNVVEGNRIFGNAVGVAVRAHSGSPRVRISQNNIFGNGQKIERCQVGGSCDATIRKGGIVFGLPGPEYESYVGTRGGGVTPDPAKLLKICPNGGSACPEASNGGVAAPVLDRARRSGAQLIVQGHLKDNPQARFTVEVFGNRQKDGTEGETFLGDAVTVSDHEGNASFTLVIDSAALGTVPASFTATSTSSEGATSEFSRPITLPD